MKTKTHLTALLSLLALTLWLSPLEAQQPKRPAKPNQESFHQQIRSAKRKYLIKELSLTEKEARDIMPILDELDMKRYQLWREGAPLGKRIRQGDKSLTDAELEKHLDYTLNASVQEAELERTYYNKCRGLLPLHKLVRLPFACKDFARDFFSKHRKDLPPHDKGAAQPKPADHPKK